MLELATKYKNIYDKMLSNSIKNSMYTAKAMQASYATLFESKNESGHPKKLTNEELHDKYTQYVKNQAKIKREEGIKKKNKEIFVSSQLNLE